MSWANAEARREYSLRYYQAHKDELLAKQKEYVKARLASPEREHVLSVKNEATRRWRLRHPDRATAGQRAQRAALKLRMFAAYGDMCACCGETAQAFLTLDHVKRDGKTHRDQFGGRGIATSRQIYLDLQRRGWPQEGYQVLCMNCNFATRFGQLCPHQEYGTEWTLGASCA